MNSFAKAVLLLFVLILLVGVLLNSRIAWPIGRFFERHQICSASRSRVAAAGGWTAVEQACLSYATNGFNPGEHNLYYISGRRIATNSLPQPIEMLQPMFLDIAKDQNGIPIFQVTLSCGHRTGMYDAPYYAIWIVATNRPDYVPVFGFRFRGAQGLVEKKGNAIFEAR